MADPGFDLSRIFRFRFMKWLIAGSTGTFIMVYLLSSTVFIKPAYRSETVIFVPLTLFSQQYNQQGIGFGNNEEIDGHIQILKSTRLLDSLDAHFNLSGLWNIDIDAPGSRSRFYRKINTMIKIEKTRYNSVSVSVRQHDPEMAAAIANRSVAMGDIIKEDILLENRLSAYNFAKELYEQKKEETEVMERHIRDTESTFPPQDKSGKPLQTGQKETEFPEHVRLITIYEAELWELTSLKNRYELLRKSLETPLPRSYIISPAVVSDKPAWPPRILLSLMAMIAFSIMMIFIRIIRMDGETVNK